MSTPRTRSRGRPIAALGGLAAALAVATAVLAQTSGGNYDLSWRALSGGNQVSGGSYVSNGAIGQPLAGSSGGGSYTVDSGFLGGGSVKFKRYIPQLARDGVP